MPTKELCDQTYRHMKALAEYCSQQVSIVAVSSTVDVTAQKYVAGEGWMCMSDACPRHVSS